MRMSKWLRPPSWSGMAIREKAAGRLGLPVGFDGGVLHGLEVGDLLALEVAGGGHAQAGGQHQHHGQRRRRPEDGAVGLAQQVPAADRQHEDPGGEHRGQDGVPQVVPGHGVADEVEEALQLRSPGDRVDAIADRVLHPGVGRQDPEGRHDRARRDQPGRGGVEPRGEAVPAEDPQAQEGRLQEEGDQALHCQRGPEDVADEAGVRLDQFMPNWNSCTMPVTTPMAKLIRNSFPQNLVARRYFGSRERTHLVSRIATTRARPMVSGTKRKW